MGSGVLIAGLGPGAVGAVPAGLTGELARADRVYLRTARHPVVPWLEGQGVRFETFDRYYEECPTFEEVYRRIAATVIAAAEQGLVAYVVPGHPLVAEEASDLILDQAGAMGLATRVLPAMSFLDALFVALRLDPTAGLFILDALEPDRLIPVGTAGMVLTQVHNRMVAGEVKIRLMAYYPDEHRVWVVRAAGVPELERIQEVPLYALDRLDWLDHLTSVYVPPGEACAGTFSLAPLVGIMATLRGRDGCPWDREQTHHSIRRYLIEETYEVLDAIERQNMHSLREELGDLLLQIVFHAQMAKEQGHFDMDDVVRSVCDKMIYRHPHVFGREKVRDADEVLANWERLKRREKGDAGKSCLADVPRNLPALLRADRVQSKAARVGFDWPDYRGAFAKLDEELVELRDVLDEGNPERTREELGDLLFAVVNVARLLNIDAEEALRLTVDKFTRRFALVEEKCRLSGREPGRVSLSEMDEWWEAAKKREKS
jgi:tetrapyrrole methylase family protein/MazG family protein